MKCPGLAATCDVVVGAVGSAAGEHSSIAIALAYESHVGIEVETSRVMCERWWMMPGHRRRSSSTNTKDGYRDLISSARSNDLLRTKRRADRASEMRPETS